MATIRQVANHAGVSIGTVSKVLNGLDEKVAPATRERVWASVRELRYRPPAFERDQKATLSQNLGLIVPDLTERPLESNGYAYHLIDGALEVAAFRGWSITIFAARMWDEAGNAVRRRYDGRCDGLLVAAPQPDGDVVPRFHERGAPIVQVGSTAWLDDVSSVDIDNHEAGRLVARHFLELGHRRLGFVTGHYPQVSAQERHEGFREAAGGRAVAIVGRRDEEDGALVRRLLGMGDACPTALMAWHDGLAFRLVAALRAAGMRVPEDVSVAGVDRTPDPRAAQVNLTSVENPVDRIARQAAAMAIDRALDHGLPREIVRHVPRLVMGATTGKPPSK